MGEDGTEFLAATKSRLCSRDTLRKHATLWGFPSLGVLHMWGTYDAPFQGYAEACIVCMKAEERTSLLAMPHKMVRSSEALDQGLGQSCFSCLSRNSSFWPLWMLSKYWISRWVGRQLKNDFHTCNYYHVKMVCGLCACVHAMWRSENNLRKLVFSFHMCVIGMELWFHPWKQAPLPTEPSCWSYLKNAPRRFRAMSYLVWAPVFKSI